MAFVETAFAWCRYPAPVKAAVPGALAQRLTPVCRGGIFKGWPVAKRSGRDGGPKGLQGHVPDRREGCFP